MGKLLLFSYVWKCVAGAEIAYFLCILSAFVLERSGRGAELHHTLFETLPGFTWISFGSVVLGAVYILAFSLVFGAFMVWMHNSSIKE